ncbi:hypothetical protein GGI07_004011 [Coemansia sp. Benny D115]|nr:hypothetical protein GGI07_004011 [Coemansia sp. Benny D115]
MAPMHPASALRRLFHSARPRQTLWSFLDTASPSVYRYAEQNSSPEPPVLSTLRLAAIAQDPADAQKMISPLQAAFLAHLVRIQNPRTILELGAYKGYSALCLAHAASAHARLWSCERDPDIADTARQNIADAGYAHSVTVLSATADDTLRDWDRSMKLDFVFIDANKAAYQRYYNYILDNDLLADNAQIVVDNVLLHGNVHSLQPTSSKKSIAQKLNAFNAYVASDSRTVSTLLPIFDGVLIATKK